MDNLERHSNVLLAIFDSTPEYVTEYKDKFLTAIKGSDDLIPFIRLRDTIHIKVGLIVTKSIITEIFDGKFYIRGDVLVANHLLPNSYMAIPHIRTIHSFREKKGFIASWGYRDIIDMDFLSGYYHD